MQTKCSINKKITEIIYSQDYSKNNKPTFFLIFKLSDGFKYKGYVNHEPYIGDIIKGTIKNNESCDNDTITLQNIQILLPEIKVEQQKRIYSLLKNNSVDCTKQEIDLFYSSFEFGKDFWFHIYNNYLGINLIEDFTIPEHIKVIYNHISKYTYNMLKNIKDELKEKGIINLTNKQTLELYLHPKFGFDITQWKFKNIIGLLKIDGFGIKTVIKISKAINASLNEISQLIILYSLINNHNGNTFIKYDYKRWLKEILNDIYLKDEINNELFDNLTEHNFNNLINELITEKKVIKINNILYEKDVYDKEHNIAKILNKINNSQTLINKFELSIEELNEQLNNEVNNIKLNNEQKQGIFEIFNNNISIIYGKAGTGKTTQLKKFVTICEQLLDNNIILWFLAPTAKAKLKMQQAIRKENENINEENKNMNEKHENINEKNKNINEKNENMNEEHENMNEENKNMNFETIHAFNYYYYNSYIKQYIKQIDITKHNIFIIDETSMVDMFMLHDFLNRVNNIDCTIVFLGDNRQLPSIGLGCVLDKLISSNIFKTTELINVIRNKINITRVLDKVIEGKPITIDDCDDKNEFRWLIPKNNNEQNLLLDILKKDDEQMIITLTNDLINKLTDNIREIKNPQNELIPIKQYDKYQNERKIIFRVGDPVVHCKNDNNLGLVNGEQGIIENIEDIENTQNILVKFKNGMQKETNSKELNNNNLIFFDKDYTYFYYNINEEPINHLKPAYMITVHKSQGQEYNNIIVILKKSRMLNRNLLYTALSRAKKSIILISTVENLNTCINKKIKRNSLLNNMITYYSLENSDYNDFETYYLTQCCNNIEEINNDYEEIYFNKQVYYLKKSTNEVFSDNLHSKLFGKYNEKKNKIIKIKAQTEIIL
jgi:exodeoxyribonuclease V alpha subunit